MEESEKKNNLLVVILLILLIAACGFIVYDKFIKKDNNNSQKDILSNEAALSLIKEKHNEANAFFGDFKSEECGENVEKSNAVACYYSTLDAFKTKFYSIYSKDLEFKDVFLDYADYETADQMKKEAYAAETSYLEKDGKIYIDNECRTGGPDAKEIDDYLLVDVSADKIDAKVQFKVTYGEEVKEETHSMVLVNENGSWKISKAPIFDSCGFVNEVGK